MNDKNADYARTRYGTSNPEWVESELWDTAVNENWSGYALQQHLGHTYDASHYGQDYSHSGYRESEPGPYWSWERFGRTSTPLPDGRVIHIGGEHEDGYDPYFCIYNDVVVEYPGGAREFYLYPKEVFPPTDFHSATLFGDSILLVGSTGYRDLRRPGETQVLKLDTRSLRIEAVATTGSGPGWISRHLIERPDEDTLLVIGGCVQTMDAFLPNPDIFELNVNTLQWRRREHGDLTIFPVSKSVYDQHKSPRYGTTNPEKADNPFWRSMLEFGWPPSRARLHFGDQAPPEPDIEFSNEILAADKAPEFGTPEGEKWMEQLRSDVERSKLKRSARNIVWTAVRDGSCKMELADGRRLIVGGEIRDYGDEYADPWVYNDVIVITPDNEVEIFLYPRDVFPHMTDPVGAVEGDHLYIIGLIGRKLHPERPRGPAVLRMNMRTYEIQEISVPNPALWVVVSSGEVDRENKRILFHTTRQTESDPQLCIAFDLAAVAWSDPFPHPYPYGADDEDD